jgi:hypothetical protein
MPAEVPVKTITLRNIPPELARKLEERRRLEGISLGKAALRILEEGAGLKKDRRPVLHHDLDSLAGTWTKEEARIFERSLRDQRKIDPEMWR